MARSNSAMAILWGKARTAGMQARGKGTTRKIVIVGGGAAGFAAAEKLGRQKYQGGIVMLSNDDAPPVDRPNLSKDYLAGSPPRSGCPCGTRAFIRKMHIDLRLNTTVAAIKVRRARGVARQRKTNSLRSPACRDRRRAGPTFPYPAPSRRTCSCFDRSSDCRAIIERAKTARRAVVLGASFIGLEVAASLRARNIEVHVVAPEERPMEKILGPDFSRLVQAIHEQHGVVFHLREYCERRRGQARNARAAEPSSRPISLSPGSACARASASPRRPVSRIDRGVAVDAFLETSAPGIFAAGDIARWPDRLTGQAIRVEHWVVAERQGQAAALNMLGQREPFDAVPFFWSQHYDVPINYVGHAESWDELAVEGDIANKDGLVRMRRAGRTLAVASVFRDLESLEAEVSLEREARESAA